MLDRTRSLWAKQDVHRGDRQRLFGAVAEGVPAQRVMYPGSYVDVAASFVWPDVTYVDQDSRARRFFADESGVRELIEAHCPGSSGHRVRYIDGDYRESLPVEPDSFDLLISLYAGFVSEHCTRYLRPGGHLLVNPSHGDAAMAAIDDRYRLAGVVTSRSGGYAVTTRTLDAYLVPKSSEAVTKDYLHEVGRGVAYTKSPFAYLFERVA